MPTSLRSHSGPGVAVLVAVALLFQCTPASAAGRIGPLLQKPAGAGTGWSHVIIRAVDDSAAAQIRPAVEQAGGVAGRPLGIIRAQSAYLPNAAVIALANNPAIEVIWSDRRVAGTMERTGPTVGATAVRSQLGYDGTGVTVAVIDSGVTAGHDDLADGSRTPRVARFVDFVAGGTVPYDDYGHGTHVTGIIAGNGFDSSGARAGIAPGATLVVLKALDATGTGRISDVIAALDFVLTNHKTLGIRIVNLSVGAGVYESYDTDALTIAARRVTEAGVVVVAAAGNAGRDPLGRTIYGGITAPGNAPWVLTVGASNHMGTVDRGDDTVAAFSSRGPTAVDFAAKPDLVAPGVGIESLSAPGSALYGRYANALLDGTVSTGSFPYMSLSGTSMAAPVVSGAVALMLQANPSLTPDQVKSVLEYTAEMQGGYDPLTQGTGFLNVDGAVQLARFLADPADVPYPASAGWSGRSPGRSNVSPVAVADGVVFVSDDDATVVWGSADVDTVVWGSSDGDTVVWGTSDVDTVVWGSSCGDPTCAPFVWGRP